ncbi:MAG: carboxylesterase family protein [Planctomycetota bacterium]
MRRKIHTQIVIVSLVLIAHLCQTALPLSAVSRQSKAPVHILGSDSFIRDWLILGMFPNPRNTLDSPDSGFHKDYLSALGGEAEAEITLNSRVSYTDEKGVRQAAQVHRAETAPSGVFHFDKLYGRVDYRLAYAFCYIESDRDQTVTSYFGSNDDAKVWVNGELVHEYPLPRSCKARQDTFTFRLKRGLNLVLVKICERWGDWAFVMEVLTDEFIASLGERPVTRVLRDIQELDLCLLGANGPEFSIAAKTFPQVRWNNPYRAQRLLGDFPFKVRWYDPDSKKVLQPQRAGPYTAVIEGVSPDGLLIRRAQRFYGKADDQQSRPIHDNASGGGWAARPKLLESHGEEPSIQLIQEGPHSAVAVSYLAHQGTSSRRSALAPSKHARTFNRYLRRGQSCLYWITLPKGYDKEVKKWPMIIYLHPSSLQGHDLSMVRTPIPPDVDEIKNDFPFVVLTPQCPDEYDAWPSDLVVELVDEAVRHYNVDARRVYVTGFSLGGRGTWSVAVDHPEVFAAIVPVAGSYGHPERISRIEDVPVWVFHGDSDRLLPIDPVRDMVQDLKESGGNVRFTIYKGAGHGITGRAYRTRELYEWLLKQQNE